MTEFLKVMETFDLISDRNLADTSSFFVIAAWNVAGLDGRRIFRSYRYPAREFHLPGALLSVCSFSTIPWKQGPSERTTAWWKTRKRWKVDSDEDFFQPIRYLHVYARERAKIVTFRFSLPSPPPPLSAFFLIIFFFPSSYESLLLLHPDVHGKDIRRIVVDPSDKTRRGTLDNSIIDRHVQLTTRVIAPFDEPGCQQKYALDPPYIGSDALGAAVSPADRDSYSLQPRSTTCAKLVV